MYIVLSKAYIDNELSVIIRISFRGRGEGEEGEEGGGANGAFVPLLPENSSVPLGIHVCTDKFPYQINTHPLLYIIIISRHIATNFPL
jgi:hypothetical protein